MIYDPTTWSESFIQYCGAYKNCKGCAQCPVKNYRTIFEQVNEAKGKINEILQTLFIIDLPKM